MALAMFASTHGRGQDIDSALKPVTEFERSINELIRARAALPDELAAGYEVRVREALGSGVSAFCRGSGNAGASVRESSDADVVEFVYSAFIGDLERLLSCPTTADTGELVAARTRTVVRCYPLGRGPGRREMLYFTQILAMSSIPDAEALRSAMLTELAQRQEPIGMPAAMPFLVTFAQMQWPLPPNLHPVGPEEEPILAALRRQFESTRRFMLSRVRRQPDSAKPIP
jgi:hypothetical protein